MVRTLPCWHAALVLLVAVSVHFVSAKPTDENSEFDIHGAHDQADLAAGPAGRMFLREALLHVPPRQLRSGLDSLSGISFGTNKRFDSLSGAAFGTQKRNFDEIDRSAFDSFIKRNFDEIDRSAFDSFVKRNFDEIDRVGFNSFYKRGRNEQPLPPATTGARN